MLGYQFKPVIHVCWGINLNQSYVCVLGYQFKPVIHVCWGINLNQSYICVLGYQFKPVIHMCAGYQFKPVIHMCAGVSISPLSMIFLLDFGIVPSPSDSMVLFGFHLIICRFYLMSLSTSNGWYLLRQ